MIFFIVYYFALPVLVGYARPLMEKRVLGPVNLAYLFALSQFFMAWIIAALYVRAANGSTGGARGNRREEPCPDESLRSRSCSCSCSIRRSFEHDHDYEHEHELGEETMTPALGMFLLFVADHAGDHLLGGAALAKRGRILHREPADHRLAKRRRGGGRLHERGVVSRDRGLDRVLRLRRLHVLRRLAGGLSHRAAGRCGTAAQRRQIHHGRCARLSAQSAAGARHGGVEHDHGQHVLHDRADGGRGRARHAVAGQLACQLPSCGHRRRDPDDYLRRLRRHAGDDLGADHQGDPADGGNDPAQPAGAGAFRLELWQFFRRRRRT